MSEATAPDLQRRMTSTSLAQSVEAYSPETFGADQIATSQMEPW